MLSRRPHWTEREKRLLASRWEAGMLAKIIAYEIGKTEPAVRHKRLRMRLPARIQRRGSE